MTDFDKRLIEKAINLSRYNYYDIDVLMKITDTREAGERLWEIRNELYNSVVETI